MIRILLKRSVLDRTFEEWPDRHDTFETFDVDLPEIEAALNRGGCGPQGFDQTSFVGISIVKEQP